MLSRLAVRQPLSATWRVGGRRHASFNAGFNPPTGYLWGKKPSEREVKEGWEALWYFGFYGGTALVIPFLVFRPGEDGMFENIDTMPLPDGSKYKVEEARWMKEVKDELERREKARAAYAKGE
ncbi:hypothetical protein BT69DRAFT_1351080 [Atractiella rhizophila]|nr:hypothetical protein BT69DRAFT_1351080 [Atractiella rhizophila]